MQMYNDNGAKYAVLDVDDVIVNISTPWIEHAMLDPELCAIIKPKLDAYGGDITAAQQARNIPYIQDWFGLSGSLRDRFDLIYRGNLNFYDNLRLTGLARTILMALSIPGRIGHVHFVTHNYSNDDPCAKSKQLFLEKHYGEYMDRCTIHQLESTTKKSSIIESVCPEPHMYADDQMKNVHDVLLNNNVRPHEIAIPRYGFNRPHNKVVALATLRRIRLDYYTPAP